MRVRAAVGGAPGRTARVRTDVVVLRREAVAPCLPRLARPLASRARRPRRRARAVRARSCPPTSSVVVHRPMRWKNATRTRLLLAPVPRRGAGRAASAPAARRRAVLRVAGHAVGQRVGHLLRPVRSASRQLSSGASGRRRRRTRDGLPAGAAELRRAAPRASRAGAACERRRRGCTPRSGRGSSRPVARRSPPARATPRTPTMLEPASRSSDVALEAVQRLELLMRVALDRRAEALADDPEQVHEHAAAQQPVDLVLARRVAAHQPLERGRLVGA